MSVVPPTTTSPFSDAVLLESVTGDERLQFDEPSSLSLPLANTKVLFISKNRPELKQIFPTLFSNNLQPVHWEIFPDLPLRADAFPHVFVDLSVPGALDWLNKATKSDTDLCPIALIQHGEREGSALAAGALTTLQHPVEAADVLLCIERNRTRIEKQQSIHESMDRERRRIATTSVEVVLTTLCQELRNPLAAALANVEYMRDTDNRDSIQVNVEEKRNILQDTLDALQRVRITMDGLATLVKREIAEPRRVAFWEVIQSVIDELGHDSSCIALSGDPTIRGFADDELLRQVLSTLLRRGVASANASGIEPAVQVRVYATETEARVSLRDNGPPLAPDAVTSLFETSDILSGPGSAGLVLAVTHHAVVRMGGILEYESRGGPGGVFRVRLRLVRANE